MGRVFAADSSGAAPALQNADKAFIVPNIDLEEYVETLLYLCSENQVSAGANFPAALVAWASGQQADPVWFQVEPNVTAARCEALIITNGKRTTPPSGRFDQSDPEHWRSRSRHDRNQRQITILKIKL